MLRVKRRRGRQSKAPMTQQQKDALYASIFAAAEQQQQASNTSKKPAPPLKTDWDAMKQRRNYDRELAIRRAQLDRMQKQMDQLGKRKPPPASKVYNPYKKNKGALSEFMRRGNQRQQFQAIHPDMTYIDREADGHCFYHSIAYGIGWQTNSTIEQFVNDNYFFPEGSLQQKDLLRKTRDIKDKLRWHADRWQQRKEGLILRNVLENIYINEYRNKPNKIKQIIDGADLAIRDLYIDSTQLDLDEHLVDKYYEPVLTLSSEGVERLQRVNSFYDKNGKKDWPDFARGYVFYMVAGSTVGARGVVLDVYKPNEEYERTKARFNHYYVKMDNGLETDMSEKFMAHDWEVVVNETKGEEQARVHSYDSKFVKNTRSWASLGVIPFALNVFRERDEGKLKFCNNLTLYMYSKAGVTTGADLWVRFYWDEVQRRYRSCLVEPGEEVEIMCSIFIYFTGNHFDALHPNSNVGTIQLNSIRYESLDDVDLTKEHKFRPCGFKTKEVSGVKLMSRLKL